jgi:chromosome segregation and condensation protein ScpB
VADGDRTLNVVALMSESDRARLLNIHKTETFVRVAIPDGVFQAAISSVRQQKADTVITILIKEKES